jgi:demethylsterigmatocystin 6-O-methyltransferase
VRHKLTESRCLDGAKVYYFRQILHDYPDAKCIDLLHLTMAAMNEDSVILIDEMVLPETGAHWHAAQIDINMMAHLASMERTAAQWHELLGAAGLSIKGIHRYFKYIGESVIVAVPT